MFERSNLLSISLIASIALTRALEKTTAGPQWECFHTQIGLETTQYNTIGHQQNTQIGHVLYCTTTTDSTTIVYQQHYGLH